MWKFGSGQNFFITAIKFTSTSKIAWNKQCRYKGGWLYIVNTTYMPCRELLCRCSCNIYACWPSVTVTNTAAVQTRLSAAARWMLAGLWPLNQHACWPFVTQYCMSAGFSICYTCWYGVSLSAVSSGMVAHYQPCLLVWCFIRGHAFWFGTSLLAMPVGVVPHYRSCLLVWCLTVGHAFWCGASL